MSTEPDPTPTPSPAPAPTPTPTPTPAPTPTPTPTPAPSAPEWLSGLSDDTLRGDETLTRYATLDDLAKGHVETMKWARGRVPIPKGDDEKARNDFVAKARPEKWEDYEVTVADGQDTGRAEAFKQKAHQLGLMPWQAKELAEWSNAFETDAVSKIGQAAKDELKTREVNLGPAGFARSNQAIDNMLSSIEGLDTETGVKGLESAFGAGAAYDLLRHFAEKTGELEKVSGDDIAQQLGQLAPDRAQKLINEKMGDSAFMAEAMKAGTKENQQWNEWNRIAAGA